MTTRRATTLLAATAVVLAACGGGDDDAAPTTTAAPASQTTAPTTTPPPTTVPSTTTPPTTTAPATTAPATTAPPTVPPTTEPAAEPTVIVAESGFLSMQVAPGWTIDQITTDTGRTYEDAGGLTWEASLTSLVELASLTRDGSNGDIAIGVFREGRTGLAPGVFDWDDAVAELLGIQPNFDLTVEWGGGRGEATRGRLGDGYARHESVQIDDQLVSVLALSADQPTEEIDDEVSAMIESIVVDPSVLPPLAHTLDTQVRISEETTGSTPFSVSVLVPPTWTMPPDTELLWADPDPEGDVGPYIEYLTELEPGPIDEVLFTELDEFGSDWLDVDPEITTVGSDDLDGAAEAIIAWEGSPGAAEAAIIVVSDEVAAIIIYIWTPGDPAMLSAMIDSILVEESAWVSGG